MILPLQTELLLSTPTNTQTTIYQLISSTPSEGNVKMHMQQQQHRSVPPCPGSAADPPLYVFRLQSSPLCHDALHVETFVSPWHPLVSTFIHMSPTVASNCHQLCLIAPHPVVANLLEGAAKRLATNGCGAIKELSRSPPAAHFMCAVGAAALKRTQ